MFITKHLKMRGCLNLKKKYLTWVLCLVFLASVVLSGCASNSNGNKDGVASTGAATGSTAPKTEDTKDIVLGVILSTSGNYASLGVAEENALKAFEKTAEPINGRKIKFLIENDQSNPTQAAAAAKTLLANKEVVGIIGPSVTATMLGAFPILQSAKIPVIFLTNLPYPNFNKEPYIFSVNLGSIEMQRTAILDYYKSVGIGVNEFEVIVPDDASGQSISKIMKEGGVNNITLAPNTLTDYSALLTQMKQKGIKSIVALASGTNGGYVRKSQLAIGYDVPLIIGPNTMNPSFLQVAGDGANGVKVIMVSSIMEPSQLPDANLQKVVTDYQTRLKDAVGKIAKDEGISSAFAWDAALSFYHAFKDLKTIDAAAIQKNLDTQQYIGAIGEVKRSSSDHSGFQQKSYFIAELKGDKIVMSSK
jgi:branched-chain amino acid transport system substrate-binding protein